MLFGTDGIRGKAGEYPVTPEVAKLLGSAVVETMGGDGEMTVLIGRDTRESGPSLEVGLIEGLLATGAKVIKLGVVPTPALASLVGKLGADAAVIITASHNPFQDNGLKVFDRHGFKPSRELEDMLEERMSAGTTGDVPGARGSVEDFSGGLEMYAEMVMKSVEGLRLDGLRIVLDAGNGGAFEIAPKIFRDLGAEVITLAVSPDGRNINQNCGAVHAEMAGRLVKESGAHLGVSLDGDADRVIFTTADGEVLSGDRVLAIGALGLKSKGLLRGDAMVATVMSNLGLDEALNKSGIKVLRAGVGDRNVLEMMRAKGLSFGGENSGHLIFSEYGTTGDGIMSALQVCQMMRDEGKSLAELASVMDEYPSVLLNLPVREKVPIEDLPALQKMISEFDRALGNEGRQLVRYSGTESKIRVLVEHKEAAVVDEWIARFRETIAEELG